MADNMDAYDTSDYPVDDPLHSRTNAKVLGKMKDECSSLAPPEFVGLRAKMYSIFLPNVKPKFTAKGVSRRYILKHLHHKDYLRTFIQNMMILKLRMSVAIRQCLVSSVEL